MNIYLIGYRCSGKTTIGKALSSKIDSSFFDTDEQIVKRYGMTINRMISEYGWSYFRIKEMEMLVEVSLNRGSSIIATGGGIVLENNNILIMKKLGVIIWLKAKINNIKNWIFFDKNTKNSRPSLTGKDLFNDIDHTFNPRVKIYDAISDFSVSTDSFDLDYICKRILQYIL